MNIIKFTSIALQNYILPASVFLAKTVFIVSGIILLLAIVYCIGWLCAKLSKEIWILIEDNFKEAPAMTVVVVSFMLFLCSSIVVFGTGGLGSLI